ncbi:conserved hypothetical protein [Ricinus communis]|uniref:Uncharacterized protein n=1 Tax=Ricinus communis TaxID=3988 RepID=B9S4B4_RICCO|nr:conserved hypothetical protein [Ricinus communis]
MRRFKVGAYASFGVQLYMQVRSIKWDSTQAWCQVRQRRKIQIQVKPKTKNHIQLGPQQLSMPNVKVAQYE